jgi:septum formation protein
MQQQSHLILASASPRRRALLEALGVAFSVQASNAHEPDSGDTPENIVLNNARIKRDDIVAKLESEAVVIAADTLVFHAGKTLAKPKDREDAMRMLRSLSGNTHSVATGIAITNMVNGQHAEGTETTHVTFRELTDAEIEIFVDTVNPLDRAGAYTVDGPGNLLVARYDGCYQNVLGLPMVKLDTLLRKVEVQLFDRIHPENALFL